MAQTIKLRRSSVAKNVPTTAQLDLGELAINTNDGKIYFEKNDGAASIQTIVTTDSQTTGSIEITGAITGSHLTVDNKLGVGTRSPNDDVEVSAQDARLRIVSERHNTSDGNSNNYTFFGYDSSGQKPFIISNQSNTPIVFRQSAGDERMRIHTGGNVGIGVLDPDSLLEVAGTTHFQGASTFDSTITAGGNLQVRKSYPDITLRADNEQRLNFSDDGDSIQSGIKNNSGTMKFYGSNSASTIRLTLNDSVISGSHVSTGSFATIRTGMTTLGSLSSGIVLGDGDSGIYETSDDSVVITAGNSLENFRVNATTIRARADEFKINTSDNTTYGINLDTANNHNKISLIGSGTQTINMSKVGRFETTTTQNTSAATFQFTGSFDQIGSFSATAQFVQLKPNVRSTNAVATSSFATLDLAGNMDMSGQTQETIRGIYIHPTKTGIGNYIAIDADGDILPGSDNSYNLGASDKRWANIYSADLQLSNEGTEGNDIDGTTGSWTIQEGEEDLFIINRKTGKKYKFLLEEVTT